MKVTDQQERFWSKVVREGHPQGCWVYEPATRMPRGYGVFRLSKSEGSIRSHRYAYQISMGPIPEGLTLDHLCRNTTCVNPQHLEPVTASENSIRAHRNKPACRHGHLYSEVGFTIGKTKGERLCNACRAKNRQLKSMREKAARAANPSTPKPWRTHCSKGHEYTEENTYWVPSTGNRACRECRKGFKSNQHKYAPNNG